MTTTEFQPLCDETRELLKPIRFHENDRLEISLSDENHFVYRAYGIRFDGTDGFSSYAASHIFFQRIPERKNLSHGKYQVSATDISAIIAKVLWRDKIIFKDENAQTVFNYLLYRFAHQTQAAKIRAEFKLNNDTGSLPNDFIRHPIYPQANYQDTALAGSLFQEASALFMEQGTGKTLVALNRIFYEAMKCDRVYRVLVVCPKNVRYNWQSELEKFCTIPGKSCVLVGGALGRLKLLTEAFLSDPDCRFTMVISSYEAISRSWNAISMIEWDLVILDESHYIKNNQTTRWKTLKKLVERSRQRMILTGTPVSNEIFDIWTQLEFLGKGLSGFNVYANFRKYYGKYAHNDAFAGHEKLVGYQNLPILKERLARLSFSISKAEALPNLPEKLYSIRSIEMAEDQAKSYLELQDQLAILIESELDKSENKALTVSNVLVQLLRLAQITSGFIKWDKNVDIDGTVLKDSEIEPFSANPKLEELMNIISELSPESKLVVWATFSWDITQISSRLASANIDHVVFRGSTSDKDRQSAIQRFNGDDDCKVFIGNPAAASTGINLWGYNPNNPGKTNCDTVVYYSQNWSMVLRSQSEDRTHRRGTRKPVQYIDLCVPGSIDEEIRCRVFDKMKTALEIQDIREIMQRLLSTTIEKDDE